MRLTVRPKILKRRIDASLMDTFRASLRYFAADAHCRRSLFETGYANQLRLQGCSRFWRSLLASQHGVHRLYISVGYVLVFLAGNVRGTQDNAGPERLIREVKARIWFTYLRQVVEFRQSGWQGKDAGPLHLHVSTGEIPNQLNGFTGMSRESGNCEAPSSQGTHSACLTTGQQGGIELIPDWRPSRLAVDVG